jgi:CubicO group peptidase (beta-lactamase class C family)
LYEGAFGKRDLAKGTDMTPDSVFWIASMTKALTATAAMQLVEQGKLKLDEPMGKLLPELAAPQVLEGFNDKSEPKLRPAKRPITLRMLLTHTASFTYDIWDANTAQYNKYANVPGIISSERRAHDPARLRSRRALGVRHKHRLRRQGSRGGQRTEPRGLSARASVPALGHERHRIRAQARSEGSSGDRACARAGRRS